MSFNKITVFGNLGKDVELRYTPQGKAVVNLSVATTEKRKDKSGELQSVTTWFKFTLWDRQAENAAKYLSKGSPVYLEGRLSVEEWTDRDGKNRYTLEVQATDMQFVGSGTKSEEAKELPAFTGGDTADQPDDTASASGDDIPF